MFGIEPADRENIIYVNWLDMVHKGIESLKMYTPTSKKWLQAHSQARYVIARVLIDTAPGLVKIDYLDAGSDGKPDLLLNFDRALVKTVGKEAIGKFLTKLQVLKSTGDIEAAKELFNGYSQVSDDLEYPYLKFRDVVMARKKARKMFVQSSTSLNGKFKELKRVSFTNCLFSLAVAFSRQRTGAEVLRIES